MKFFKTFESFSKDGIDVDDTKLPEYNMSNRKDVKEYVESKISSEDYKVIFDVANMEPPVNVDEDEFSRIYDEAKELAIEYYLKNPEEMTGNNLSFKTYPVKSSSVPQVQNTGVSLRESYDGKVKIDINDEDMNLLLEEPIQDLVRNQKISILNNQIWFDDKDKETKDTLDIYFEFDKNTFEVDESLKSKSDKGNRTLDMLKTATFHHYDSPKGVMSPLKGEDTRKRLVSKLSKEDKKNYREWIKTSDGVKSLDKFKD